MALYNITQVDSLGSLLQVTDQAAGGFLGIGLLIIIFAVIVIVLLKNDRSIGEAVTGGGFFAAICGIILRAIPSNLGGQLIPYKIIVIFIIITAIGMFLLFSDR